MEKIRLKTLKAPIWIFIYFYTYFYRPNFYAHQKESKILLAQSWVQYRFKDCSPFSFQKSKLLQVSLVYSCDGNKYLIQCDEFFFPIIIIWNILHVRSVSKKRDMNLYAKCCSFHRSKFVAEFLTTILLVFPALNYEFISIQI